MRLHASMESCATLGAFALALAMSSPAMGAEEATVTAFMVWQGQGQLHQTGVEAATFVGALEGVLYIETDQGPVAMGDMTCPATVHVNISDGTQVGSGRCVIVGDDGARLFAEIACEGVHLVGCRGDFTLVGGEGRFAGIEGGGPVTIRSEVATLAKSVTGSVEETASGLLYLPSVHYTIP